MEKRSLFIKPSRPFKGPQPKLDPVVIGQNKMAGLFTALVLDTNIIISMEKIVKSGNKWSSVKAQGLHNLVRLLQRSPPESVSISPGHALSEMPPQLARQARSAYEIFCQKHLPSFSDAPGSEQEKFEGQFEKYGFLDIPQEVRASLSITFSCILYMNVVDRCRKGTPIEKFKAYLDYLEDKVDFLSATEIEIAKYCFWEPPAFNKELIKKRRKIRQNNLKTGDNKAPENINEAIDIAYNAARDIYLLHTCNWLDSMNLNGEPQDTWIVTKDKKLVEFCELFHHVEIGGEAGKAAASRVLPEHENDAYWNEANADFMRRSVKRLPNKMKKRDLSESDLLAISDESIRIAREAFQAS